MTTLGKVRVRGVVRRGGRPVEGAYVTLNAGDEFIAERRTGPDGVYEFHTAPGDWVIRCRAAGTEAASVAFTSEGGDLTFDFDL